jgi:hypothetical protein
VFGCISVDLVHHRHLDADVVKIDPITLFKSKILQASDKSTAQQLVISGTSCQANFGSVHVEALAALNLHMKHEKAQIRLLKPKTSTDRIETQQVPIKNKASKPKSVTTVSLQFNLLSATFTHPLCRAPVLVLLLNNLVLARQTFLRQQMLRSPTISSVLLVSLGSLSLNMCSLGICVAPPKDASSYTHPAFSLRFESASDGSSLILSKLNGAFIAIDLKVIRTLSKVWKTPSMRLKTSATSASSSSSTKDSVPKKQKSSWLAGLHFLSDMTSTVIRVGQGDAVSEFSANGILFRNRGHHLSNWPHSFNAGCPFSWIMSSNVASADSAASCPSDFKAEVRAAIIAELQALEAVVGPSAVQSVAKARDRLLARISDADSPSRTRQSGGTDWSWGGDNVQALHAQADRLVSINRCIKFCIESVFASECSHGARIVRMRELRAITLSNLGSGQASKVGEGDDSPWTTEGERQLDACAISSLFASLLFHHFAGMRNAFLMFLEHESAPRMKALACFCWRAFRFP